MRGLERKSTGEHDEGESEKKSKSVGEGWRESTSVVWNVCVSERRREKEKSARNRRLQKIPKKERQRQCERRKESIRTTRRRSETEEEKGQREKRQTERKERGKTERKERARTRERREGQKEETERESVLACCLC